VSTRDERIVPFEVREKLVEAIRAHAKFAVDFEASANSYDRPIAETPWLAKYRYGDGTYDARWYALQGALTHFNEGLGGAIDAALGEFERTSYAMGRLES